MPSIMQKVTGTYSIVPYLFFLIRFGVGFFGAGITIFGVGLRFGFFFFFFVVDSDMIIPRYIEI